MREPNEARLSASLVLRCPICHETLECHAESSLECDGCGHQFPVIGGVPVLINEGNSVFRIEEVIRPGPHAFDPQRDSGARRWLKSRLPRMSVNHSVERLMRAFHDSIREAYPNGARVLVVGGGILGRGIAELDRDPSIELVESDIFLGPRNQILFDCHDIPFDDESFDGIVSQAVLEHVLDPFRCVAEFERVLRPNGFVFAGTSFMQQVHGGRHDFMRFTLSGHRFLFRSFDEIETGVAVGPGSALAWSWMYFLASFARTARQRHAANLLGRLTGFYWRFFDRVLHTRPAAIDAASSVFFFGRKSPDGRRLTPREVLDSYRGGAPV